MRKNTNPSRQKKKHPREITRDAAFAPCAVDEDDEIFRNGRFHFNITKLMAFLIEPASGHAAALVEIKGFFSGALGLDPETIENADLDRPIILAEIAPEMFSVIDGNHRIAQAQKQGVERLPAYSVKPEVHTRFLITQRGYEAYVNYWNEKLR